MTTLIATSRPTECCVAAIDRAHAALAELLEDRVAAVELAADEVIAGRPMRTRRVLSAGSVRPRDTSLLARRAVSGFAAAAFGGAGGGGSGVTVVLGLRGGAQGRSRRVS